MSIGLENLTIRDLTPQLTAQSWKKELSDYNSICFIQWYEYVTPIHHFPNFQPLGKVFHFQ